VVALESAGHEALYSRLLANLRSKRKRLAVARRILPGLSRKTASFYRPLSSHSEKGMRTVEVAPYWMIVAERHGFPPAEDKSIAHVLEKPIDEVLTEEAAHWVP